MALNNLMTLRHLAIWKHTIVTEKLGRNITIKSIQHIIEAQSVNPF